MTVTSSLEEYLGALFYGKYDEMKKSLVQKN